MVIRTGLVIIILLVLTATTVSASDWVGKGTVFHTKGSLVWIVWNATYISQQPCEIGKDHFVVGGVKWIYTSTGAINISIDKYDPKAFYENGGVGFVFTVYPSTPCTFTLEIVGIPKGKYVLIKKVGYEVTSMNLHASRLTIKDYVDRPTTYTLKIVEFEGKPSEVPTVKIPIEEKEKKLITPSFESVFAIAGLVATAFLLRKSN